MDEDPQGNYWFPERLFHASWEHGFTWEIRPWAKMYTDPQGNDWYHENMVKFDKNY